MLKIIKYIFGFGYKPKFNDKVKIVNGFYRGHTGIVTKPAMFGDDVWVEFDRLQSQTKLKSQDLFSPYELEELT